MNDGQKSFKLIFTRGKKVARSKNFYCFFFLLDFFHREWFLLVRQTTFRFARSGNSPLMTLTTTVVSIIERFLHI